MRTVFSDVEHTWYNSYHSHQNLFSINFNTSIFFKCMTYWASMNTLLLIIQVTGMEVCRASTNSKQRWQIIILLVVALGSVLQVMWLTVCTGIVGYVPEGSFKRWLNYHVSIMCFGVLSSALSAVITYHNPENRPKCGICVANHTSPIDVLVLACDNCYALVGWGSSSCLVLCVVQSEVVYVNLSSCFVSLSGVINVFVIINQSVLDITWKRKVLKYGYHSNSSKNGNIR